MLHCSSALVHPFISKLITHIGSKITQVINVKGGFTSSQFIILKQTVTWTLNRSYSYSLKTSTAQSPSHRTENHCAYVYTDSITFIQRASPVLQVFNCTPPRLAQLSCHENVTEQKCGLEKKGLNMVCGLLGGSRCSLMTHRCTVSMTPQYPNSHSREHFTLKYVLRWTFSSV